MKKVTIGRKCGYCDEDQHMEVDEVAWNRFDMREGLVQDLFPDLSAPERELVMGARNGFGYYCGSCWDKMFVSEDEE